MDYQNVSEIFNLMPGRVREILKKVPVSVFETLTEFRVRSGKFLVIILKDRTVFLHSDGSLLSKPDRECVCLDRGEVRAVFERLCDYSVYSQTENLINGFVTMDCGNRVGIASSAVLKDGQICAVKDISSLNFRISRQVIGCSENILNSVFYKGVKSVIIAGPPGSGKTTILRDLCRNLSNGYLNKYYKVCVVDERKEIASVKNGIPTNDVGINTDVLDLYPKGKGIEVALRVLSPDIIVCDEIGSSEEMSQIISGINSGVKFILTVHASTREELLRKSQILRLIRTGEFEKCVLLGTASAPGLIKKIFNLNKEEE